MDLKTGEWKPQGISSCRGEENVAIGSCRGAKAVREYKPQGIGFCRAVEYISISTHKGFISAEDLLL